MDDLSYFLNNENKKKSKIEKFLKNNKNIKFVSLFGIDFMGNDTDEKIPARYFLNNIDSIFNGGIQTDGSSVNLPGIASLSDARVNFVIDFQRKWFIDYNYENMINNSIPVGTLRIPAFLKHHDKFYDSRSILFNVIRHTENEIKKIIKNNKSIFKNKYDFQFEDIKKVYFTLGTELEFWVRTPADKVSPEELELSQMLKESYWKRTKGRVRTCLENSLLLLNRYDLNAEMGHKEVGGVKGKVSPSGDLFDVMEQIELDWQYSDPVQACDNELFVRIFVKELFRRKGLEVSFMAKPVEGVAGSGEHMHLGMGVLLNNGDKINLFAPTEEDQYLSSIGYGGLMGILKNWDEINPFISHSIDSMKRLKPGYEAPISPVVCLGGDYKDILRNRTILIGVVRSDNPLSVRFEVRAPNPHTNSYFASAVLFLAMLDGIKYSIGKNEKKLYNELSKDYNEDSEYLNKDRKYLTTKNIFDDFSKEERRKYFGKSPETVWENIKKIKNNYPKILKGSPLNQKIINSFVLSVLNKWEVEIIQKEIPNIKKDLNKLKRIKNKESDIDRELWNEIHEEMQEIFKSSIINKSLLERLEDNVEEKKYEKVNEHIKQVRRKKNYLEKKYLKYRKNFLE